MGQTGCVRGVTPFPPSPLKPPEGNMAAPPPLTRWARSPPRPRSWGRGFPLTTPPLLRPGRAVELSPPPRGACAVRPPPCGGEPGGSGSAGAAAAPRLPRAVSAGRRAGVERGWDGMGWGRAARGESKGKGVCLLGSLGGRQRSGSVSSRSAFRMLRKSVFIAPLRVLSYKSCSVCVRCRINTSALGKCPPTSLSRGSFV